MEIWHKRSSSLKVATKPSQGFPPPERIPYPGSCLLHEQGYLRSEGLVDVRGYSQNILDFINKVFLFQAKDVHRVVADEKVHTQCRGN
jgi:hypothetical protein